MKKAFGAVTVLAALLVAGCSPTTEGGPSAREDESSTRSAVEDSPSDLTVDASAESEPAAPAEPEPTSGAVRIGEGVYEYEDGLVVEVSGLAPYEPGEFSFGADAADSAITFVVTVTNGTPDPVDLAITTVNVNAGPAGNVAEQIFDGDIGGGFQGAVLPGNAASAPYAFAVNAADLGEIVIEIEPGFLEYDAAYFEGALA